MIQLTYSFMASILRELLPALMSENRIGEWFTFSQISSSVTLLHYKFLEVIARHFSFEANPPISPPSVSCSEMEVERQFRVTLDTVIRFVLVELMLVKREYVQQEMDNLIGNMLLTYLPVGVVEFSEQQAKQKLPQIIGQYFLTIPKVPQAVRVYYNPLLFDFNVKARVQAISVFKKKFSRAEIFGLFSVWYSSKQVEDILLKNFRKMGKDFEIKLLIPK